MSRRAHFAALILAGCFGLAASQSVFAAPGEGNGKRAELRQRALQKFDKNGNGKLDPDEREAAKEAMQKRREQGGGKGPGGRGGPARDGPVPAAAPGPDGRRLSGRSHARAAGSATTAPRVRRTARPVRHRRRGLREPRRSPASTWRSTSGPCRSPVRPQR
jgi:hypothetical protein